MANDKELAEKARLPKMLNSTQVAKALGVNPSTLSRWRSEGVGPRVYWLGTSSPRYREDDVLAWLEGVAS
jgi:predicted DNA-binding transcriptional regulator AlpA